MEWTSIKKSNTSALVESNHDHHPIACRVANYTSLWYFDCNCLIYLPRIAWNNE